MPLAKLLLVFGALLTQVVGLPGAAQSADGKLTFTYSSDSEDLLIRARRSRTLPGVDGSQDLSWTIYVYGDGRVEMDPLPSWLEGRVIRLEPTAIDQLLRSLDGALQLSHHHSLLPAPEQGSFVEVHLRRYESADRLEVFQYLEAVVTRDLEVALEELTLLRKWLALGFATRPVFVSGPPWPRLCEPERRLELGLGVAEPSWCSAPAFDRGSNALSEEDPARRAAIRARLLERLRSLPRGLPDGS